MGRLRAVVGTIGLASGLLLLGGCEAKGAPPSSAASGPAREINAATPQAQSPLPPLPEAKVGAPAPEFELGDLDGNKIKLASYRGSVVVLEWFNPECPFVKKSHTKGSLVDTAARHTKQGVVWLAINSGAPGKQGAGVEKNRAGRETFKLTHPILLDEDGR